MTHALAAIVAALIAFGVGWVYAHQVVAKECERLGGFYVGKKVFKCVEVDSPYVDWRKVEQ